MTDNGRLVMTRVLPASAERVFAAWTREELIKQWFCPGKDMTIPVAEIDAREGGNYRIVMQNSQGDTYSPSGSYETVVPNRKLVFSWKWADSELVTRVTIELREIDENQTELTLTHEGFPAREILDRHNEGWEGCLNRFSDFLSSKHSKE